MPKLRIRGDHWVSVASAVFSSSARNGWLNTIGGLALALLVERPAQDAHPAVDLMIVYAILTEQSIGRLFARVWFGLLVAGALGCNLAMVTIWLWLVEAVWSVHRLRRIGTL